MEDEKMLPALLPRSADEALRHSPFQTLRRLRVEENAQELIVSGSVASYYLKQQAQEILLPFLGSRALRNRIVVLPKGRAGSEDAPRQ